MVDAVAAKDRQRPIDRYGHRQQTRGDVATPPLGFGIIKRAAAAVTRRFTQEASIRRCRCLMRQLRGDRATDIGQRQVIAQYRRAIGIPIFVYRHGRCTSLFAHAFAFLMLSLPSRYLALSLREQS
jgi:hypothetical protein